MLLYILEPIGPSVPTFSLRMKCVIFTFSDPTNPEQDRTRIGLAASEPDSYLKQVPILPSGKLKNCFQAVNMERRKHGCSRDGCTVNFVTGWDGYERWVPDQDPHILGSRIRIRIKALELKLGSGLA